MTWSENISESIAIYVAPCFIRTRPSPNARHYSKHFCLLWPTITSRLRAPFLDKVVTSRTPRCRCPLIIISFHCRESERSRRRRERKKNSQPIIEVSKNEKPKEKRKNFKKLVRERNSRWWASENIFMYNKKCLVKRGDCTTFSVPRKFRVFCLGLHETAASRNNWLRQTVKLSKWKIVFRVGFASSQRKNHRNRR